MLVPKDSQRLLAAVQRRCFQLLHAFLLRLFCLSSPCPAGHGKESSFKGVPWSCFSVPAIPSTARQLQGRGSSPLVVEIISSLPYVLSARHGWAWASGNCLDSSPELGVTASVRWEGTCGVLLKQDQLWDQTRLLRAFLQAGLENIPRREQAQPLPRT